MALGIRVVQVCLAHPRHLVQQGRVLQRGLAQFGPVLPDAPADGVVNGGQREALVVQVTVFHGVFLVIKTAKCCGNFF